MATRHRSRQCFVRGARTFGGVGRAPSRRGARSPGRTSRARPGARRAFPEHGPVLAMRAQRIPLTARGRAAEATPTERARNDRGLREPAAPIPNRRRRRRPRRALRALQRLLRRHVRSPLASRPGPRERARLGQPRAEPPLRHCPRRRGRGRRRAPRALRRPRWPTADHDPRHVLGHHAARVRHRGHRGARAPRGARRPLRLVAAALRRNTETPRAWKTRSARTSSPPPARASAEDGPPRARA